MSKNIILGFAIALFALIIIRAPEADAQPTRFTVETRGEGPDVILIPGLGTARDAWAGEADRLDDDHRVHLVQINGFAGAQAGANAQGDLLDAIVADLAAYIDAQHIEAPAIVGHSMGGLLGLMLAAEHPEAVGKLVVVDALPFFSVIYDPNATSRTVAPIAAQMRNNLISMDDSSFRAQQEQGVARLVRTEAARPEVIEWTLASDRSVFARAMYEVMITDMRERIGAIGAPLMVLYAYDPAMGSQQMIDGVYARSYAQAPDATLGRVDGSFHFIMLDQPDVLHAALAAFLAQ